MGANWGVDRVNKWGVNLSLDPVNLISQCNGGDSVCRYGTNYYPARQVRIWDT